MTRKSKLVFLTLILFLSATAVFSDPVDINSATIEQLDAAMVNVGKAKAEAIVRDREKNGKFKSIEDIVRVKGIKAATLALNRNKIIAK